MSFKEKALRQMHLSIHCNIIRMVLKTHFVFRHIMIFTDINQGTNKRDWANTLIDTFMCSLSKEFTQIYCLNT